VPESLGRDWIGDLGSWDPVITDSVIRDSVIRDSVIRDSVTVFKLDCLSILDKSKISGDL
jgi:hypothetical protein